MISREKNEFIVRSLMISDDSRRLTQRNVVYLQKFWRKGLPQIFCHGSNYALSIEASVEESVLTLRQYYRENST